MRCFLIIACVIILALPLKSALPDDMPIERAICLSDSEDLARLLREGHSPNIVLESFNMPPLTLVFDFVGCGHPIDTMSLAKVLINEGADVNFGGKYGYTPLMAAMMTCQYRGIELLIASGANVNARDAAGKTPLMYLSGGPDLVPCIKLLIANGADITATASDGTTARSQAVKFGNKKAENYLRSIMPK